MMVKTLEMNEAPAQWENVVSLLASGAEILLTREGALVARIVPEPPARPPRIGGLHEGMGWISPDFDDPLPDSAQDSDY